jgi:hypothetical protein
MSLAHRRADHGRPVAPAVPQLLGVRELCMRGLEHPQVGDFAGRLQRECRVLSRELQGEVQWERALGHRRPVQLGVEGADRTPVRDVEEQSGIDVQRLR